MSSELIVTAECDERNYQYGTITNSNDFNDVFIDYDKKSYKFANLQEEVRHNELVESLTPKDGRCDKCERLAYNYAEGWKNGKHVVYHIDTTDNKLGDKYCYKHLREALGFDR